MNYIESKKYFKEKKAKEEFVQLSIERKSKKNKENKNSNKS